MSSDESLSGKPADDATGISRAAGLLAWLAFFGGLLVIGALTAPVFLHGFVHVPPPSGATVTAMRTAPADGILTELAGQTLQGRPIPSGGEAVQQADRMLRRLPLTEDMAMPYTLPFSLGDMHRNDGAGQLSYSSLYLAVIFLRAFDAAGDPRYLDAARDVIIAYARHERSAWRQDGFLWNDHAVAARAGVLIDFWRLYRQHPSFSPELAAELLQQAGRCAALLAKPEHFRVATNHGVMQNLALLQLAAAFPALEGVLEYRRLAMDRLALQLRFYVSDEGFVLEHSAGYHEEGSRLVGLALRLAEMNGQEVPPGWKDKAARSREVTQTLTRPDGTLPVFGDTDIQLPGRKPGAMARGGPGSLALYPLSGYAVWTYGKGADLRSHSVLTWSNFPGHGHKLADEMSLVLWERGRGWLTNIGYWSYFHPARLTAEGWAGSNAPHTPGEQAVGLRRTALEGHAVAADALALVLRRTVADGNSRIRQVVSLANGVTVVVDSSAGLLPVAGETAWTFYPDLDLHEIGGGDFVLRDPADGAEMGVRVSSPGAAVSVHRGSREPFAGWVARNQKPVPASAIRVLSPPGSWAGTIFAPGGASATAFEYRAESAWQARGPGWRLVRDGGTIKVEIEGVSSSLPLAAAPDVQMARRELDRAIAEAEAAYPRVRDMDSYRIRVAQILGLCLLVQSIGLVALMRLGRRPMAARASLALALCWLGGWGFLQFRYFV